MIGTHQEAEPNSQLTPRGRFRVDTLRTRVGFSVRHLTGRVQGAFTHVAGSVKYDARSPEAIVVCIAIQSASILTHNAARDARLRSPGFLNVRAFPEIGFAATGARRCRRSLEVTGDLTIRGVARPVTVTVGRVRRSAGDGADPAGRASGLSVVARAEVLRSEFGVAANAELELGGLMLGDVIAIEIDVELVQE